MMCTYLHRYGSTYYFRRGVPKDVQHLIRTESGKPRTEWRVSLRTKEREEAKRKIPEHTLATDRLIAKAQEVLANEGAKSPVASSKTRAAMPPRVADEMERDSLEAAELFAREQFEEEMRAAEDPAFALDLELRAEKAQELRRMRERRQDSELAAQHRQTRSVSLKGLFESYASVDGRHPKTIAQWRPYFKKLSDFLGHDDALAVRTKDLIAWRNFLRDEAAYRGKKLSAQTINGSYLGALSTVLAWAFDDGIIDHNPMIGVQKVKAPKAPKLREKEFTSSEVRAILGASLQPETGRAGKEWQSAKRWCPWIMAYSGARVNEVTQLRKEDVIEEDGVPAFRFTPEAGSIKARAARIVPIHTDLISQGFLSFVAQHEAGPLFFNPALRRSDNAINRQANRLGSKLAQWVRSLGIEGVKPNHGWRHLFNTLSVQHGLDHRVTMAILGHSTGQVNQNYGSVPLVTKAKELEKLPRFEIAP